jgi:hypothetical protein
LKGKYLLPLLISIILILIMLATSCTPAGGPAATVTVTTTATATTTATPAAVVKDKTYRALNPRGIEPSVQIKPLAARLDTPDGKTIYVNQGEADPIIMPALWIRLQKEYTKTTWKLIEASNFGPNTPEDEVLKNAKAVIRGISW